MAEVYPAGHGVNMPGQSRTIDEKTAKVIGGGSSLGAFCGLATVVLTILALADLLPVQLCAIAIIVAGLGLMVEGAAVASRSQQVRAAAIEADPEHGEAIVETGMTSELLGGIAAIVIGILALIHIAPLVLLGVGGIVLGAALLFGSGDNYETIEGPGFHHISGANTHSVHMTAKGSTGATVLISVAAIALGILSVVGVDASQAPLLAVIAILCVGVAELVGDSALAARMISMFHHS